MQGVHEAQSDAPTVAGGVATPAVSTRTLRRDWLALWPHVRLPIGLVALLTLPFVSVALDLGRRSDRVLAFEGDYRLTYLAALLESLVVWSALLYAGSRTRGVTRHVSAVLFVAFGTFAIGGQTYFFQQYGAYLNKDVSIFAANFRESVVNQLFADFSNYLRAKLPILALTLGLIWLGRRTLRPTRWPSLVAAIVAPLLVVGSFFIPTQHRHVQASTPDVLYLNSIGGLLLTQFGFTEQSNQLRPRLRESMPVPKLAVAPGTPKRNVVFVILESVRAAATCIEHDPECQRTGATNVAFPNRFPFTNMRSMDSCTAISLSVLWSGLHSTESRERMHTWPLIFDYAKAAGYDTAYWTSQNMLFGNVRLWVKNLGVRKFVSATDLDPTSDLDMGAPERYLAERVNAEIDELREPFMAVIQTSNVHYPYYIDPNGPQPFQPSTTSKAPDENTAFLNYYQNSVFQQDQHVAKMLRHLRETEAGKHTVIVYTSDHGEAFREHGQMGHTFSIFEEETHVPMWIDAPPGTLTEEEERNLRAKRDAYLFHIDLAPTILDLLGVGNDGGIDEYKAGMHGHSLLRPALTEEVVPMTNCGGVWSCAFENWGVMQKNLKLEARSWDPGWKCYDVEADPDERIDLGPEACGGLLGAAMSTYGRLPGQGVPKKN
ncbi:MAG TPA: sulfatase-like hydrolase/transferase [Polyangiaceae bacterium]|nr:sulfatase-like hydrolase/transferase [Polyangiaceae bacterium]